MATSRIWFTKTGAAVGCSTSFTGRHTVAVPLAPALNERGRHCFPHKAPRRSALRTVVPIAKRPQASAAADGGATDGNPVGGLLTQPATQSRAYQLLCAVALLGGVTRVAFTEQYLAACFQGVATPATAVQVAFSGASWFVVAAILHALKEAAEHGRLASTTYQRLNLAVVLHAVLMAVLDALACRNGLVSPSVFGVHITFALALGFVCDTINGQTDSSTSIVNTALSLGAAVPRALLSLLRPANLLSAAYAALALSAGTAGLLCLLINTRWMLAVLARHLPATIVGLELFFKRTVGNGLLTSAIALYTLKDAADRGRQDASTFRLLGHALALQAAISLAVMHFYRSNRGYLPPQGWTPAWQSLMIAILVVCGFSSARSAWIKRAK
ncbi:hypothetical protein WJX72_001309 [[Myrmecia] bisecta]|uniref:Uncharacterized protein n=1 Tax=[Myrmecia] bisecta TaxID=41462 RepID=A0AAW1PSC3_9CHLO